MENFLLKNDKSNALNFDFVYIFLTIETVVTVLQYEFCNQFFFILTLVFK